MRLGRGRLLASGAPGDDFWVSLPYRWVWWKASESLAGGWGKDNSRFPSGVTAKGLWRQAPRFGADGVRYGFGVVVHEGFGFGFDHDAGEGFGAGVADDDAAGVGEGLLGGGDGGGRRWGWFRGGLFATFTLTMTCGKVLRSCRSSAREVAGAVDDVEEEEGGEEAVAGGGAAGEDDVAGLLAAE